jgi:MFS family permease
MTPPRSRAAIVRGLVRRDLMVVCLVIFMANIANGAIAGSFSLYAQGLGASVAQVGLLTSFTGIAAIALAVPIGLAADRYGRKRTIASGMLGFTAAHLVLATAPSAMWLAPSRIFAGASVIAAIWMSSVILADVATDEERPIAYGFFTTIIGFAYALGPLVLRAISDLSSDRFAYASFAGLALLGAAIAITAVPATTGAASPEGARIGLRKNLRDAGSRAIAAVCVANTLIAISFVGVVFTMVPLVVQDYGIATTAVAGLLTIRTIASTLIRFPSGALVAQVGTRRVLIASLIVCIGAIAGLGAADTRGEFLLFMVIEGLGYGMFLASSQAYIAENTVTATRGAAMGIVTMTSGFGVFLAPLTLGLIGDAYGLSTIFPVAVVVMTVGLIAVLGISRAVPAGRPQPAAT